jgi:hypothetical protein
MTEVRNTASIHSDNSSKVDTFLQVAAASYGDGREIWQSSQMDASSLEALQNLLEVSNNNAVINNEAMNEQQLQQQRLFQLMERQTAMIIDLHRRLDDLVAAQQPAAPLWSRQTEAPSQAQETTLRLQKTTPFSAPSRPNVAVVPPITRTGAQTAQPAAAAPQQRGEIVAPPQPDVPTFQAKLVRAMDLFMKLRRRQVQDDFGLIFKVAFVVAILLSRIQRRNNYYNSNSNAAGSSTSMMTWNIQSVATVFAVMMGLLAHMGYLSLLYRFFYQYQYFQRILWDGEEITVEMALQEESTRPARHRRQQPEGERAVNPDDARPAERAENDPADGWRHTVLGGGIAPALDDEDDDEAGQNENRSFLLRTLQDIFLFVASFFLSIFPMWHPAAIPRAAVADENRDEPPLPPLEEPPNNDGQSLLPRVPSPVDPTEPLEESDTDELEGDTL